MKNSALATSSVAALFCASFASAGVIVPTLQMELQQGGQTIWMIEPAGVPSDSGDNTFAYGGQWNNSDVEILYEVEASPGPASSGQRGSQLAFINASTDVTNNSMMTQHFTVIANLPVVGPIIPAVMGGSAQGGMTAGPNAPATLSSVAGSSIYAGLIDLMIASGSELFPHLTSITVMDPFESDSLGSMSFGTPIPSAPAPDVLTSIGIRFDFALDPGATATLSGVFAVNIPTPASLALFGAAGIFAARRRRA